MSKALPEGLRGRKTDYSMTVVIPCFPCLVSMGALRPLFWFRFAIQALFSESSVSIFCLCFPFVWFWVVTPTLQGAKCIVFLSKTNDFSKRPFCPPCSSKRPRVLPTAHFSPPRSPWTPHPRPQGPPKAPQGHPDGPPRPPPGARLGAQVGLAKHVVL